MLEKYNVEKIVWFMWLQGFHDAPAIVKSCFTSWKQHNPSWQIEFIDASNLYDYLPTHTLQELLIKSDITAASFSDLVRLELLHEYGGVWADSTLLCQKPLDVWLPEVTENGLFMFSRPGEDRHIASWFIAARAGNILIDKWKSHVNSYWESRKSTDDYFWLHHAFTDLLLTDSEALAAWKLTPSIAAGPCHRLQAFGLLEEINNPTELLSDDVPVMKLTYRIPPVRRDENYESLLERILSLYPPTLSADDHTSDEDVVEKDHLPFVTLSISTNNLGDHIQAAALERLLALHKVDFQKSFDRDKELDMVEKPYSMVLSGWGNDHWPPSEALDPLYISFHMCPHQSPKLLEEEALTHYKKNEPILCRDSATTNRLTDLGVSAALSHCFTTTFPRRSKPEHVGRVYVVSRDERICEYVPDSYQNYKFISHYSGSTIHSVNMTEAQALLEEYKENASLIITTLLHCALPAMAMGIPTIVCWPLNSEEGHRLDDESFLSLQKLVPIHTLEELKNNAINVVEPAMSSTKILLRKALAKGLRQRKYMNIINAEYLADSSTLPPPLSPAEIPKEYSIKESRLRRLYDTNLISDPKRWGQQDSYQEFGSKRAEIAAAYTEEGARILELGVGKGDYRKLVTGRVHYTGVDLNPLNEVDIQCDLEKDPLPKGTFDTVVMLGVLEYLSDVPKIAEQVSKISQKIIFSYCVPTGNSDVINNFRTQEDWVNAFSDEEILNLFSQNSFSLVKETVFDDLDYFKQKVYLLEKAEAA